MIRSLCCLAAALAMYFAVPQVGLAQTLSGSYTIDAGNATAGTNFNSFTDFATALAANGVSGPVIADVQPGSGPYTEQVWFTNVSGTSTTNTVTINGNGDSLLFDTAGVNNSIMIFDSVTHFVLEDLTLVGIGSNVLAGILFSHQADSNTISDCVVDMYTYAESSALSCICTSSDLQSAGAAGNSATGLIIENNTTVGGVDCILLVGPSQSNPGSGHIVRNNLVRDFKSRGIYGKNQQSMVVMNNDISRANRTSVSTFYGIRITGSNFGVPGCDVIGNRIHNTHDNATNKSGNTYGINFTVAYTTPDQPHRVINNLVYNLNGTGYTYGIYDNGANTVHYRHNTVVIDEAATVAINPARGIHSSFNNAESTIQNNLVSITRGGSADVHGIWAGAAPQKVDHNLVYVNSVGGNEYYGYSSGNRGSVADWKANTSNGVGYGQGSFQANPNFVDPGNGDFAPTAFEACNTGVDLDILTDINDAERDLPDLGAIEFCESVTNVIVHQLTDTTAVLRWDTVAGATAYKITVRDYINSTKVAVFKHGNQGQKRLHNLDPAKLYWVHVSARINGQWSVRTRAVKFTTLATPCLPVSVYSAAPVGAVQARINWTSPAGISKIWLRWREAGTTQWIDTIMRNPAANKQWITGLTPGTSYDWQIKSACNAIGQGSNWSPVQQLATATNKWEGSAAEATNAGALVQVFPNPASSALNVVLSASEHTSYQLSLLNAIGQTVWAQTQPVAPGATNAVVNVRELHQGLYFLRVENGGHVELLRVMID